MKDDLITNRCLSYHFVHATRAQAGTNSISNSWKDRKTFWAQDVEKTFKNQNGNQIEIVGKLTREQNLIID